MRHLIFDTETTDLIANTARPLHKQPRIVEFFGVVVDDGMQEVERLHLLFNPGIPMPAKAAQITGITDAMLADAKPFNPEAIDALIRSADRVVAHNLSYDKSVLDFEFARCGRKVFWPHGICTVEATESLLGFRLSLTRLHEHLLGEPFADAHRAEVDVAALTRCYAKLIELGEV